MEELAEARAGVSGFERISMSVLKIKYDLSETGGSRIQAAGVYTVKIKEIKLNDDRDDMISVIYIDKDSNIQYDNIMLSGKGAFTFELLANAIGVKLKESGGIDLSTWIGKVLDIEVEYDDEYDNYKVTKKAKKGTLTKAATGSLANDFDEEAANTPIKKEVKETKKATTVEIDDTVDEDEDDDEWA